MRIITVSNPKDLVFGIVDNKKIYDFLVGRKLYERLKEVATSENEIEMNFNSKDNEIAIKFEIFCKAYYRLERLTVNGDLIYGYSKWTNHKEQIVLDAE